MNKWEYKKKKGFQWLKLLCSLFNLIAIGICLNFSNELKAGHDFLYVRSKVDIRFERAGFGTDFHGYLNPGLRYFFLGMILLYLISILLRGLQVRLINLWDAIAYFVTAAGMGIYMLLIMHCRKVVITSRNPWFFRCLCLFVILGILQLLIVLLEKKKKNAARNTEKEAEITEKTNKNTWVLIPILVCMLGSLLVYGVKLAGAWKVYDAFKGNYGAYFEMRKDAPIEQSQRDYMNNAVVVDGEIIFSGELYHGSEKAVLKVTREGKVESFLSLEEQQDMDTFVYVDGYIFSIWCHGNVESLVRISMDGEMEVVGSDVLTQVDYLNCVDNQIVFAAKRDGAYNLYYADAKDIMDLSKHKLYLANVSLLQGAASYPDGIAKLYLSITCGEKYIGEIQSDGTHQYICRKDGWYYNINRITGGHELREASSYPGELSRYHRDGKDKEILADNVTEYNFYGDTLYYAVATETGAEIIKSNLDGSNKEVIYTTEDGTRCQKIVVSDGYILCRMTNIYIQREHLKPDDGEEIPYIQEDVVLAF